MFFQSPVLTGAEVDENRIEQIATLLSEKPAGFGLPISDRRAWEKLTIAPDMTQPRRAGGR
jgi:hypothetical protein